MSASSMRCATVSVRRELRCRAHARPLRRKPAGHAWLETGRRDGYRVARAGWGVVKAFVMAMGGRAWERTTSDVVIKSSAALMTTGPPRRSCADTCRGYSDSDPEPFNPRKCMRLVFSTTSLLQKRSMYADGTCPLCSARARGLRHER